MSAFSAQMCAALLLTIAADFLFFGQPLGISVLIFCCLLVGAIVAVHRVVLARRIPAALIALAAGVLLPLAENVSGLSLAVAILGLSAFALSVSNRLRAGPANIARRIVAFLIAAPLLLPRDLGRAQDAATRLNRTGMSLGGVLIWIMPIVLGAVFFILFSLANPVIDYWLSLIDLRVILNLLDVWRLTFWLLVVTTAWAFLRPRLPKWSRRPTSPTLELLATVPGTNTTTNTVLKHAIFGEGAILRALIVFNALFAVQTALDMSYLWAGVELPNGLSYAEYAHRGAYPLIVTALLAAAFVLVAMRQGSATSANNVVRKLVYLWIAQNVILVISSILRLDLYVGIYSLTYWRVAAFIWMGLVAAGLVLIMARIALGRSNEWLLSANLLTLSATLYVCCFINFAAMIAHYNVMHSREMGGGGLGLDVWYLGSLGPAAIPAMDMLVKEVASVDPGLAKTVLLKRTTATNGLFNQWLNWRSWSFRDWRLIRYLEGHSAPAQAGGSVLSP